MSVIMADNAWWQLILYKITAIVKCIYLLVYHEMKGYKVSACVWMNILAFCLQGLNVSADRCWRCWPKPNIEISVVHLLVNVRSSDG